VFSRGFLLVPHGYGWRSILEKTLWKSLGGLLPHKKLFDAQSYFGEDKALIEFLERNPSCFVVDIGAADGMTGSNTVEAFKRLNCSGVMIETSGVCFAQLALNYVDEYNVDLIRRKFSVSDVPPMIEMYGLGSIQYALSIDIDGYDIYVAEEFLKHSRPLFACFEWNPLFPPEFMFSVSVSAEVWQGDWFFGSSIRSWESMLKKYDYGISKVCGMSIICEPMTVLETSLTSKEIFQKYYADKSFPKTPISSLVGEFESSDAVRIEISNILAKYKGRYKLLEISE
jgi:hypothetical protein